MPSRSFAFRISTASMLTLCVLTSASSAEDLPVQRVAAVRVVETKLPFASAVDPYRWMEDSSSSELVSWADRQNAYTHALLAKHTNAAELLKRVSVLASARDEVIQIRRRADSVFYLKRPAKANTFELFVRNDKGGPEKLLFDPTAIGKNASIDFQEPSPNGRYDALGVSASGSEEPTLFVVDVVSGRTLSERIGNTRGAMPQWRPDSQSFFYMRHPNVDPGAPAAARAQKRRSYLHRIGTGAEQDVARRHRGRHRRLHRSWPRCVSADAPPSVARQGDPDQLGCAGPGPLRSDRSAE